MNWLRLSIVVSSITSSITWSYECPDGAMNCHRCKKYNDGQMDILCSSSHGVGFEVSIQPNELVSVNCLGNPNWMDFDLEMKNPIKIITSAINIKNCNLPKTGLAAVMEKFNVGEVLSLDVQSLKNGTSLTKETFRGFTNLRRLELSFSNLSNLTENLLEDLKQLRDVDFESNNFEKVPINFSGNSNLRAIRLASNLFKTIEAHTFDGLPNLHTLDLGKNKLRNLLPNTFDGLNSLVELHMYGNFFETLPKGIFKNMRKLEIINLSDNNFTGKALPGDLFKDNVQLVVVIISKNKRNMTSLPNGFFANLTKLQSVYLKEDGLTSLPENLFRGTRNLKLIRIYKNFLKMLPSEIFKDTKELLLIDLSCNNLYYLPDEVFLELGKLQSLDLSVNHLTRVNEKLFAGLRSLTELRMNNNNLKTIDTWAFKFTKKLSLIELSNNELTLQPTPRSILSSISSPFHTCNELQSLHLSHNNVSNIFEDWKTSLNLKVLDLSHNQLQVLRDTDLKFLSQNLEVNLDYNNVTYIDLATVEALAVNSSRSHSVSIENNPIQCDCRLYDFLRYLEGRLHLNVKNTLKLLIGKSKCHGPRDFRETAITDLRSKTFKCNVEERCPEECNCYMRPENNGFIVDCSYKGLIEAPRKLDYPPNHRIDRIELNLTGNYVTKMPHLGQNGYNEVTILALDHNHISSVTVDGLSNKLEVLYLNNNSITRLSSDAIHFLKNARTLRNLTLEGNPWLCNCDARDFQHFIHVKGVSNLELVKVKCNGHNKSILDMTPEELCPTENTWIIAGCLTITFAGIIIGTFVAVYYRYQQAIKIWLFAHQCCRSIVTEDELDRDELYDTFVSYSHKDDAFVENEILPKLEEGPRPYKTCIHTRDWLAGEWIPEQITRSVKESRRTIIILSPNFLESIWGRTEFRTAHLEGLKERRSRIIVVIYGEIGPIENLDPELKCYIKMNVCITWGDPWFWDKLKYALDHLSEFTTGIEQIV